MKNKLTLSVLFIFLTVLVSMLFQDVRTKVCRFSGGLICIQVGPLYSDIQGFIDAKEREKLTDKQKR